MDRDNAAETRRPARSASAHRMNIGLTLLALVFLTVMAAAAGVRATRSRASVTPRGETLAVLGVTPGLGDSATLPTGGRTSNNKALPARR